MDTSFQTTEKAASEHKWLLVDAAGKTLGRLATEIATLLRGKHKPTFAPHTDIGDFVVVINAAQVELTGTKRKTKIYTHHTGYVGGVKHIPAERMLDEHPERLIEKAVWGMLPKGPLGHQIINKLKVYPGAEHPHTAQKPQPYKVKFH